MTHDEMIATKKNFIRTVWSDAKTRVIIQTWIAGEFNTWVEYDLEQLDNLIDHLFNCRNELEKELKGRVIQ
jgi:hypothetical protein